MELIADAPSYSIQLDGKVVGFDSELDPEQADALAEQIQGLIEQIARFEEKNTLTCNQVQTSPTTVSGSIRTVRRDTWYAPNVKFKEIVMDEAPRFQLEKNWKNKCVRNRR